jgi:quinoprotein glucose dehydrogenase
MCLNRLAPPDMEFHLILVFFLTPGRSPQMPQGLPLFKPPYSRMTAIDMNSGAHVWMKPSGSGERVRNHPLLKGLDLPALGGDSTFSGPLLTRTLLIFALTTGGISGGARLVAYDKTSGQELGSVDLPGAAIGTPMTYMLDGRQYVALTVQGSSREALPELIAFTLP